MKYLKCDSIENPGDILYDNFSDLDLHFFNSNMQKLYAPYLLPEELQNFQDHDEDENISVLYLNSRSLTKILKVLNAFINPRLYFSITSFSERWLNNSNVDNSNYELQNYVSMYQKRTHHKESGISIYIHKNFELEIKNDLTVKVILYSMLKIYLLDHDKNKNSQDLGFEV